MIVRAICVFVMLDKFLYVQHSVWIHMSVFLALFESFMLYQAKDDVFVIEPDAKIG